jgi:hypothetical protein
MAMASIVMKPQILSAYLKIPELTNSSATPLQFRRAYQGFFHFGQNSFGGSYIKPNHPTCPFTVFLRFYIRGAISPRLVISFLSFQSKHHFMGPSNPRTHTQNAAAEPSSGEYCSRLQANRSIVAPCANFGLILSILGCHLVGHQFQNSQ